MMKTNFRVKWIAGIVSVAAVAPALYAQQTMINGTPLGDPTSGKDWNVTDNTGSLQQRWDSGSVDLKSSGNTIGHTDGYAYTYAKVGHLDVAIYKNVSLTGDPFPLSPNNTAQFQVNASASFYDTLAFAGSGQGSVTFTPNFSIFTKTTAYPQAYPESFQSTLFGGTEANDAQQQVVVYLSYTVQNASNQTVASILQGYTENYTSNTLDPVRSNNIPNIGMAGDIEAITFDLQTGYKLYIHGYASATVMVAATHGGTNWGQADAAGMVRMDLTGLTAGWTYSTLSGASLTAVPEPSTYALIGGLLALGLSFWWQRRAR